MEEKFEVRDNELIVRYLLTKEEIRLLQHVKKLGIMRWSFSFNGLANGLDDSGKYAMSDCEELEAVGFLREVNEDMYRIELGTKGKRYLEEVDKIKDLLNGE